MQVQIKTPFQVWYRNYLLLGLNCILPVVHACEYFQLIHLEQTTALQKFVHSYLDSKLSCNPAWTLGGDLAPGRDWNHVNGQRVLFQPRDETLFVVIDFPKTMITSLITVGDSLNLKIRISHQKDSISCLSFGSVSHEIDRLLGNIIFAREHDRPQLS